MRKYTVSAMVYIHADVIAESPVNAAEIVSRAFDDWTLSTSDLKKLNQLNNLSSMARFVGLSSILAENECELIAVSGRDVRQVCPITPART